MALSHEDWFLRFLTLIYHSHSSMIMSSTSSPWVYKAPSAGFLTLVSMFIPSYSLVWLSPMVPCGRLWLIWPLPCARTVFSCALLVVYVLPWLLPFGIFAIHSRDKWRPNISTSPPPLLYCPAIPLRDNYVEYQYISLYMSWIDLYYR